MKKKRILSWLMTVAMVLSLVPAAAMAAEEENNDSQEEATYVLMNIPYADFYQAELGESNTVPVDAVSSATLNKTRTNTNTMAGGSYHVDKDGKDITGVIFPVKVENLSDLSGFHQVQETDSVEITVTNRGTTSTQTYTGKAALFEQESYSYYVLDTVPTYYKEATFENGKLTFGEVKGTVTSVENVDVELLTESSYGDYQINLTGEALTNALGNSNVSGIVLTTDKGSYGLRHLENIWRGTSLAFSTGFTAQVHGSQTAPNHYKAIMGQTINKITYYTDQGIYEIDGLSLYVPIKVKNSFAVTDAGISKRKTDVTTEGLTGYDTFTCSNKDITYQNGTLTWEESAVQPGTYTLTATDSKDRYAPVSTTFTLSTTDTVAKYDEDTKALTKADSATDAAFENYLKNITSVSVDGTTYAASGRGAVEIIQEDGSIDLEAKSGETAVFGIGIYTVTVSSTGYADLTFTINTAFGDEEGSDTEQDPYRITSVAQLNAMRDDLDAHYKLTADINLGNATWTPIGAFSPAEGSETGEDPDPAYAFTGTFDGDNHTISNLTVIGDTAVGLFGCVGEGGTIKNLTVKDVNVTGSCMAAAVAGYAYKAAVENVTLTATENGENTITANAMGADETAMAPNMVAGIVGAGMDSTLTNCTVKNTTLTANGLNAATALGDNVHDIGLVGGGLEGCTLSGCSASDSTVTVTGPYAFGIGGLSGCAMSSDKVENCSVTGVEIKAEGNNAYLVGGLVGYTGLTDGDTTALNNCDVSDTPIIVGTDAARVGGLVGGGFYLEIYKDYFPVPTAFTVDEESSVAGTAITAGTGSTAIGTVAGHTYQSEVKATTGQETNTVTIGETQVTNPQAVGAVQPVSSGSHSSGGSSTAVTYPVTTPTSAANGKVSVSPQNAKAGAVVTITATPNSGYELKSLTVTDQNGKAIALTDNGDGTYSFTMPDGKVNVSTDFQAQQQPTPSTGFADVAAGTYYADAVQWAVEQGITNGTAPATFSPEEACTRGQVVTFLWRAMGSPTPAGTGSAFTDVPAGTYYADAVQWAVEQGITNGTAPDAFSPEETVTRGQVVTFLWRLASQPDASGPSFSDVAADAYYAGAVRWAMQEEITNGTAPNTFSPKEACTRGQIVTFLYRDLAQ